MTSVTAPCDPLLMAFDHPESHISTVASYPEANPRDDSNVAPRETRESVWPQVVIVFGLGLTIAWIGLLGFGLIKLIAYAM